MSHSGGTHHAGIFGGRVGDIAVSVDCRVSVRRRTARHGLLLRNVVSAESKVGERMFTLSFVFVGIAAAALVVIVAFAAFLNRK